jgi:isoquinoline 1-oxidoreductase beta subunit
MTASRRTFLKATGAAGAGLALSFYLPTEACADETPAKDAKEFVPNAFLRIGTDGRVTITVPRSEMGQGVRTSLPMILAEELEADWTRVVVEQAVPGPAFARLRTSGSGSVYAAWRPLRVAGATAREMLVTAAAARWSVERATCRAENGSVVHAQTGRRLGYGDLAAAAAAVPVPQNPPLKDPKQFRIVGTRVPRYDGPQIVVGSARFGLDVRVPGMKRATIARCPVLGGKVGRFDDRKARAVPGVRAVVAVSTGVAVVADTTWAALEGRKALEVTWDEGPNRAFASGAYREQLATAARGTGQGMPGKPTRREGQGAAALAGAATKLDALYTYPFQVHAPIEPANAVADVRRDRCEIWAPTQNPDRIRTDAAALLGLAPDAVRVNVTLLGGAFGRRLGIDYAIEAVEVSRAAGAPVQVVWSREDDTRHGFFQPASAHYVRGGLDASGKLVAWTHTKAGYLQNLFGRPPADQLADPDFWQIPSWGVYDIPYSIANIETAYVEVEAPVPNGPWRAVFSPGSTFARECFLDELAHAARRDPLAFRLDLLSPGRTVQAGGLALDQGRLARVLTLAGEKAGWGTPLPKGWGRGVAANIYDGDTYIAYVVEASVEAGRVRARRVVCACDPGAVVNPLGAEAQIEGGILFGLSTAIGGEITIRDGRVEQSSFDDYPVVRMDEAPRIEIHLAPGGDSPAGLGEPPVPPIAPALANAVFAATGRRLRALPFRFEGK